MVVSILPAVEGAQTPNTLNGTFKHENVWGAEIHGILENATHFLTFGNLRFPTPKRFAFDGPKNQGFLRISSDAKIGLNENKVLEVNAAYKYSKKVKKYKYRYKKVKAAYKYKIYRHKVKSSSVGAYNVVVTSKYVMATGRHSCAMKDNYNYHTRVFKNSNPATGHGGVLKFEEGPYYGYNRGTSPEGLWVATDTDMDFCLVHGMSHDNRGVHLLPYNGVVNGKTVVNGYFV